MYMPLWYVLHVIPGSHILTPKLKQWCLEFMMQALLGAWGPCGNFIWLDEKLFVSGAKKWKGKQQVFHDSDRYLEVILLCHCLTIALQKPFCLVPSYQGCCPTVVE